MISNIAFSLAVSLSLIWLPALDFFFFVNVETFKRVHQFAFLSYVDDLHYILHWANGIFVICEVLGEF